MAMVANDPKAAKRLGILNLWVEIMLRPTKAANSVLEDL